MSQSGSCNRLKLFNSAIPIVFGIGCFFYSSVLYGQTRFNLRDSISYGAAVFIGVNEINGQFCVVGKSILNTDTGSYAPMFSAFYTLEGEYLEHHQFIKPAGSYNLRNNTGNNYINEIIEYSSMGPTYDETTESVAGFIASFNEEGDTNSVILFHSPYLEEYGEDFIRPLTIEPSTNADNSFFVSSNIFKMEGGTGTDCWIQRMTPEGETLWSYIYATEANPDNCEVMLSTSSGGVLLAILDNIQGAKLIELDSLGQEVSSFDSDVLQGFNDMLRTEDANLIISTITQGLNNGWRPRISKITLEGELIWTEFFGTDSPTTFIDQEFTNLVHTQDGNYVAGGVNYEYVENPTDTTGTHNKNGWLVKVSDDGEVLWDRKYSFVNSPQDNHTLNDLKATGDGGFIFCGEATDLDPDLTYSEGPPQQGWLVKVDEHGCLVEGCQLSDNVNELSAEQKEYFKAGPIPAGQFLNIYQSETAHLSTYQLINSNGQEVEEFPSMSKGTTLMLDVSKYPVGGYQLVLSKGNELLQSKKILIE